MKFLVYESTGVNVVATFRRLGQDAVLVSEIMPFDTGDDEILSRAVAENRILVTNDKDFGEMVYRTRRAHKGVLLFRLHDESAKNRARVATTVVSDLGTRLQNAFTVASEQAVRIRGEG